MFARPSSLAVLDLQLSVSQGRRFIPDGSFLFGRLGGRLTHRLIIRFHNLDHGAIGIDEKVVWIAFFYVVLAHEIRGDPEVQASADSFHRYLIHGCKAHPISLDS